MVKISISQMVGKFCGGEKEGKVIFTHLYDLLMKGEFVELNFEGVVLVSSTFFNVAIGDLLDTFNRQFLDTHLVFLNMRERDKFVVDRSLRAMKKVG